MRKTALVVAMTVLLGGWAACAGTLTLRDEALVKGPKLLLGDIADIQDTNAASLASLDLGMAPLPGESRQVNASLVEARLRSAGVKEFSVKGALAVRATTMSSEITPDMVAESLRLFIESQMPWDAANTEIDIPAIQSGLVVPDGQVCFTWRASPQYRYLGQGAFQGAISVDGRVHKVITCRAMVESYANVVVAQNDIPRGKPISPKEVELRRMPLSNAPSGAMTNLEEVLARVASRSIFPGQVVTRRVIEMPVVVRRRQTVPVELASGPMQVQTQAVAMMDGRVGDLIICANTGSEDTFQGTVRADGVIMVK